ncbi:MAG: DNA repair protein RecO [Gammaproteobacteria bacterium]|nr:DNA repair protein RecO [Gammaproteobacteria bacterium]
MQHGKPLLEPAYILRHQDYGDTSSLLELLTATHGRFSAIAKGARGKRSPWRGLMLPALPLLVSCVGRGELLTVTQVEPNGSSLILRGEALFSLFYVNELVMYLLHRFDPHPRLYEHYAKTLAELGNASAIEIPLRLFEWVLLQELGYGLGLDDTRQAIDPDARYYIDTEMQVQALEFARYDVQESYSGKTLLGLAHQNLPSDVLVLREAKQLTRTLLAPLLGNRKIMSRTLYKQV